MKKCVLIVVMCLISFSAQLFAQDSPRFEVFGGYQFTRIGGAGGANTNGWNAALTADVNRWFGVQADFSGAYKSIAGFSAKAHTYTFGPVVSMPGERVKPFAHALFGGFNASAGFGGLGTSTNGFTMMLGGGVDVAASARWSVRVVQADWLLWNTQGLTEKKNARISTGLVFRF